GPAMAGPQGERHMRSFSSHLLLTALVIGLSGCVESQSQSKETTDSTGEVQTMAAGEYLTIPFRTITGEDTKLSDYSGKVLLIVNTASEGGYTPQYEGLQKLYETYKDSGLVVIGFPANNFGGQEPGTNEE